MARRIESIQELERLTYGSSMDVRKADAPLTTSTSGTANAVYGAFAWSQLNHEANAFAVLPKNPWSRSGWRTVTSKATPNTNQGNTVKGGTPEGGKVAEAVKPNFAQTDVIPQIVQLPFQSTTVREWLATNSGDDYYGNGLDGMRTIMATRHTELLNEMILADVEKPASSASAAFGGVNDFETLDRIISSDAEEDQFGGSHGDWYDPWDAIDRDSSTAHDSTVMSASGTLGTNGILTDDRIREFRMKIMQKSGKDSSVYISGHEVYNEIQGIYTPNVRYGLLGESQMSVDVGGIGTYDGVGVGLHVKTVYGVPFIPSKDAPNNADDTSEVGRLLALDISDPEASGFPRLGVQIAQPTKYLEIGSNTPGYPWITGGFVEEALYYIMGQTICRSFKSQAKLRDIKV